MVLTQHLTDDTRRFLIRFVVSIAQSHHSIKNAAVNGFETVSHIGQGTRNNY